MTLAEGDLPRAGGLVDDACEVARKAGLPYALGFQPSSCGATFRHTDGDVGGPRRPTANPCPWPEPTPAASPPPLPAWLAWPGCGGGDRRGHDVAWSGHRPCRCVVANGHGGGPQPRQASCGLTDGGPSAQRRSPMQQPPWEINQHEGEPVTRHLAGFELRVPGPYRPP